jgi:indole-3-glycerol phosphate synthase
LSISETINIIAEFKRRSPSKGVIRSQADPGEIASDYADGGAAGISVLTEENYFDGSLEDLRIVRSVVNLPILRKDFILDDYQIYEAAAAGADAVLLIVAALDDHLLEDLRLLIEEELEMDAVVEVHDENELQRGIECGATLIGVNNRDLRSFEVSLETSFKLIAHSPPGTIFISESGLNNSKDLVILRNEGYRGFLIGESLMCASSPRDALRELLSNTL